jgi:F-type H+-transporting ATPase subunit delta
VPSAAARRYARAVFDLAQDRGELDQWQQRLNLLRAVFAEPQVQAIVANPAIPRQRRTEVIDVIDPDGLGAEGRNLAKLLIEGGRTAAITDIAEEFERLADDAAGRIRGTATTAVELDGNEQQKLARDLSSRLGREVRLAFRVDRAILGGLVLRLGDRLIDASLRSRLLQLRRTLAGS